jgi:hypothetical protein
MNNTEKKLDALIAALGFDVEVIHTTTLSGQPLQKPEINSPFVKVSAEEVRNIVHKVDYKLTKRKDPLDELYFGMTLRVLTDNIIRIQHDPTLKTKDKWILYTKEAYDAVYDWFEDKVIIWSDGKSFEVFGVKVILDE